jgi:hypothetical protein
MSDGKINMLDFRTTLNTTDLLRTISEYLIKLPVGSQNFKVIKNTKSQAFSKKTINNHK